MPWADLLGLIESFYPKAGGEKTYTLETMLRIHLLQDWNRRFSNRRQRGVDRFWSEERKKLLRGEEGTRDWSP